jgi:uncharacterized membrane protein YdjX (TVP38/TMEM64 family)
MMDRIRPLLTARRVGAIALSLVAFAIGAALLVGAGPDGLERAARRAADELAGLPRAVQLAVAFAACVVLLVCLVPSPLVIAGAGLVLGAWAGVSVAICAIAVAVLVERWLAASIVGDLLHARLAARHPDADERIRSNGLAGVLVLRALGTPTTVLAWASSATALRRWQLSLGCAVGSLPRGVAYATIGATGASLLRPSEWDTAVWASMALLVALVFVSLLTGARARSTRREQRSRGVERDGSSAQD